MSLSMRSKFVSLVAGLLILVILLQGLCVEGKKSSAESVIVINAGGGGC